MNEIKCQNCSHQEICKFQGDAVLLKNQIEATRESIKNSCFSIDLFCRNYSYNGQSFRLKY